jgi:hypothetical protein
VSKQQLRLTSRALRAEVDRSISHLEVRYEKHVMRLDCVPWQPKSFVLHPQAGPDMGWMYLKAGSSTSGIRAISRLQALVIHDSQFTKAMQQVRSEGFTTTAVDAHDALTCRPDNADIPEC